VNVGSATAPSADLSEGNLDRKLAWWLVLVLGFSAINYAGNFSSSSSTKGKISVLYDYSTAVGSVVIYAILLGLVILIVRPRLDLLALRPPRSWWHAAGLAVLVLVVVFAANAALDPFLHAGREQDIVPKHWIPKYAGAFAVNWIVVGVVAPFVEELTFRGAGFSLLARRLSTIWTIVAVGLLFGLAHGLVQALPELALLGAALAWLRWKTDSVYPGMVVHGLFNSIALASVILR
jgi:uncharacterized protein